MLAIEYTAASICKRHKYTIYIGGFHSLANLNLLKKRKKTLNFM